MTESTPNGQQKRTAIIQLRNIIKFFIVGDQKIPVLKDVSLDIFEGDFMIIFGPSGCGKSTILHTLLGLEAPTKGTVSIKAKDLYSRPPDEISDERKRHFGTIYQQSNWINALSVVENVSFPLTLRGVDKHEALTTAMEQLRSVGMEQWANHRPTELSAGQQQKVSLARCLITNPDLIIADEPTGNLDHRSGKSLMDLFKELNHQGKTIVMVTHDIAYLTYAKTIAQIFDGEVINIVDTKGKTNDDLQKILLTPEEELQTKLKQTNIKTEDYFQVKQKRYSKPLAQRIQHFIPSLLRGFLEIIIVELLLVLYVLNAILTNTTTFFFSKIKPLSRIGSKLIIEPWQRLYYTITRTDKKLDAEKSIKRIDLIHLSMRHLNAKRSRSFITIGGIGIGIGFILFLLSIGYGLENLVIDRVASLKERQQVQVIPSISANLLISDKTVAQFDAIDGSEDVLPAISVAAKMRYSTSNLDVVTYAVPSSYIDNLDAEIEEGSNLAKDATYVPSVEPVVQNAEESADQVTDGTLITDEEAETQGISDTLLTLPAEERSALINTYLVKTLNLDTKNIVGKQIALQYILNGVQVGEDQNVTTEFITYTIIGVINDETTPVVFVPIADLQQLGVTNYSQATILAENSEVVRSIRESIKALGYTTYSVNDTIIQIEEIFRLFKLALAGIGLIGLSIATLGMINTLTVSLLERTREIGFMKAVGMRSSEVFNLMITEATAMGAIGGVAGLTFGFVTGKLVSLIISLLSVTQGTGFINISYIPGILVLITLFLSAAIGTATGIYPAQRSTHISALNALRYE